MSYDVIQCLDLLLSQVQAITWGVLSLLGILLYTDTIEWQPREDVSDRFLMVLVYMYFDPKSKCLA